LAPRETVYRYALLDTILGLGGAWLVNGAILVVAAAVFHAEGLVIADLAEAYRTLTPLLGPLAALAFALALLASGLASSTTGTLAAQRVVEGFLGGRAQGARIRLLVRLAAMLPASLALTLGLPAMGLIVLSQVVLSFALPFVLLPLAHLTGRRDLMGGFANRPLVALLAWGSAGGVVLLNLWLLART
jgi:manganese transport protein